MKSKPKRLKPVYGWAIIDGGIDPHRVLKSKKEAMRYAPSYCRVVRVKVMEVKRGK